MRQPLSFSVAFALLFAVGTSTAAPPSVPAQISYQGVLLDDVGVARTGPVDLTVRIWDGLLGSAVLVYKQELSGVALEQGVFSIQLGPAGSATDTPTDPLTTDLAAAFTADLTAAPQRFIELTVDGDTAQTRTQILSAPLALRAQSAETADTATSATTAATALNVTSVNGLDSTALNEIFEHFLFDGSNPPNDDPSEGTGDTDGDGLANFIDPDNDDDGISDGAELAQGTDINLVTPTVTGVNPAVTDFGFAETVTVSGTNFEPGMSVAFGTQNPTPTNVSGTSFDVTVGPQAQGFFPDVTVTRTNGESDTASGLFEFSGFMPTVLTATPALAFADETVNVSVTGTNFVPGITVTFGTENPVPSNITPTSFDVTVGPQPIGLASITVTRPNGVSGLGLHLFDFRDPLQGIDFPHGSPGPVSSFDVSTAGISVVGDLVDELQDQTWSTNALIDPVGTLGAFDLAFDPTDTLGGIVLLDLPGDCRVQARKDANANFKIFAGEGVTVETLTGSCSITSPSADYLANGGLVGAYSREGSDLVVIADRDNDTDFTDPGDYTVVDTGLTSVLAEAAASPTGQVAVAYRANAGSGFFGRLLHDRNGDGDFDDADEDLTLPTTNSLDCLDVAFDPSGRIGVLYQEDQASHATLLQDRNDDGDFDDAGENQTFGTVGGTQCALTSIPTGFALVHDASGVYSVLKDLDDDGDFDSPGEGVTITMPVSTSTNLAADATGQLYIGTPTFVNLRP